MALPTKWQVAAIEPQSECVWPSDWGVHIVEQMQAEHSNALVYLVRVNSSYFARKGGQ